MRDQTGGFIKVSNVGGVDQDRVFRAVNKMVCVEKTAFDKIQIFLGFRLVACFQRLRFNKQ